MVLNYFRKRKLTVVIQAFELMRRYPKSSCRTKYGNILVWKGKLQPTPLSQEYTIRLRYRLNKRPEVHVIDPVLKVPEGENLLHVFSGDELCLYFYGEWQPDMNIAETIIPWVSEWLLHYEIWLATGEWQGGGIHPKINEERIKHKTKYPIKEITANSRKSTPQILNAQISNL
jgi:hypothetical protein